MNNTEYTADNLDFLSEKELNKLCGDINVRKLKYYFIESKFRSDTHYYITHIGAVEKSLMESTDFSLILDTVNDMILKKFGNRENYFLVANHLNTIVNLDVMGDFKFKVIYGDCTPKELENLIADILHFDNEITTDDESLAENPWTFTTSYMKAVKYKNNSIKIQNMCIASWIAIAETITDLRKLVVG